jgi:hypothetical protein
VQLMCTCAGRCSPLLLTGAQLSQLKFLFLFLLDRSRAADSKHTACPPPLCLAASSALMACAHTPASEAACPKHSSVNV